MSESPVFALEANCTLRREVGDDFSAREAISEAQLQACERLFDDASDSFFTEAAADMARLNALANTPLNDLEAVLVPVHNVQSLAKILGFTLISNLCMLVVHTVHSRKLAEHKKAALLVELIHALDLTFLRRIRDDGGAFGTQLRADLNRSL